MMSTKYQSETGQDVDLKADWIRLKKLASFVRFPPHLTCEDINVVHGSLRGGDLCQEIRYIFFVTIIGHHEEWCALART